MKTMRKMMLVVMSVFSLAACGVDSPEDSAPAVHCKVNSDCLERACDLVTETCVTAQEIEPKPSAPSPAQQFGFDQKLDAPTIDLAPNPAQQFGFDQKLDAPMIDLATTSCLWHSDCASSFCNLSTRTCYPF